MIIQDNMGGLPIWNDPYARSYAPQARAAEMRLTLEAKYTKDLDNDSGQEEYPALIIHTPCYACKLKARHAVSTCLTDQEARPWQLRGILIPRRQRPKR